MYQCTSFLHCLSVLVSIHHNVPVYQFSSMRIMALIFQVCHVPDCVGTVRSRFLACHAVYSVPCNIVREAVTSHYVPTNLHSVTVGILSLSDTADLIWYLVK